MIRYALSLAGKAHGDKNCKECSKTLELGDGWYMALVANGIDGIVPAENGAEGAKKAVESVATFCGRNMPLNHNTESIKSMLWTAFDFAMKEIKKTADEKSESLISYDTTLTVAIYNGRKIIYGHSGDGAIIGLNSSGKYIRVVTPQTVDQYCTSVPLRAGHSYWDINEWDEELAAVMIVTEGMHSVITSYMLRENGSGVYVPLATYFMDPEGFSRGENRIEKIRKFLKDGTSFETEEEYYARLKKIYTAKKLSDVERVIQKITVNNAPVTFVNDNPCDKTVAVLINSEFQIKAAPDEYYQEPDWVKLREEFSDEVHQAFLNYGRTPRRFFAPSREPGSVEHRTDFMYMGGHGTFYRFDEAHYNEKFLNAKKGDQINLVLYNLHTEQLDEITFELTGYRKVGEKYLHITGFIADCAEYFEISIEFFIPEPLKSNISVIASAKPWQGFY